MFMKPADEYIEALYMRLNIAPAVIIDVDAGVIFEEMEQFGCIAKLTQYEDLVSFVIFYEFQRCASRAASEAKDKCTFRGKIEEIHTFQAFFSNYT